VNVSAATRTSFCPRTGEETGLVDAAVADRELSQRVTLRVPLLAVAAWYASSGWWSRAEPIRTGGGPSTKP
jgi:hypothetical protein